MALLWSDDFNRPDASGFAGVGNGWAVAGGDIDIVSNTLRRTGGGYCISYNPTDVSLPADLRIEADVILDGGEGATAEWFGVALKYDTLTGDGIKVLLQAWDADVDTEIRIGTSSSPFINETTVLDTTLPVAGWAADGTHILALEVEGSLCSVFFDDVLVAHATYTPATPGANIALVGDPATEEFAIDAVRVYDLESGPVVGWQRKVNRHCTYLQQKTVGGNTNYVKRRPGVVTGLGGGQLVNIRVGHSGETYAGVDRRTDPDANAAGVYVTY